MIAKIIEFPKDKIKRTVPDQFQKELANQRKHSSADAEIETFLANAFDELIDGYGFDPNVPGFQKDFAYMSDGVKAMFYRFYQLEHPLHSVIEQTVKFMPVGEALEDQEDEPLQILFTPMFVVPKKYKKDDNDPKSFA